jgi:hypothetical protein
MVRFQADADLNQVIVSALIRRVPRVEFQTAADASLDGLDDLAVLGLAARERRILVTHDSKTMPRHFASFIESEASPGVVVVPQSLPVPRAVEDLLLVASATSPEDWVNRICYLPL